MKRAHPRFAAKDPNSLKVIRAITALQEEGAFREAADVFEDEFFVESSSSSVKNNAILDAVMNKRDIQALFKVVLHERMAKSFSRTYVTPENNGNESVLVDFYFCHKDLIQTSNSKLVEDQTRDILENKNAWKYAVANLPCFVLPIPGYINFTDVFKQIQPAALFELKQELCALIEYENLRNLTGPQWLEYSKAAEISRTVQAVTEHYTGQSLLSIDTNSIYDKEDSIDQNMVSYLVLAPVPLIPDECTAMADICYAYNLYGQLMSGAEMAAKALMQMSCEQSIEHTDLTIYVCYDQFEINEVCNISIEVQTQSSGEILVEQHLCFVPEVWTPDNFLEIIEQAVQCIFKNHLNAGLLEYD